MITEVTGAFLAFAGWKRNILLIGLVWFGLVGWSTKDLFLSSFGVQSWPTCLLARSNVMHIAHCLWIICFLFYHLLSFLSL